MTYVNFSYILFAIVNACIANKLQISFVLVFIHEHVTFLGIFNREEIAS